MDNILHIFGQEAWHDDVNIYGDWEALTGLRNAINEILKSSGQCKVSHEKFFVNDGEGYTVYVHLIKKGDILRVPYTDEIAKDTKADEGVK